MPIGRTLLDTEETQGCTSRGETLTFGDATLASTMGLPSMSGSVGW